MPFYESPFFILVATLLSCFLLIKLNIKVIDLVIIKTKSTSIHWRFLKQALNAVILILAMHFAIARVDQLKVLGSTLLVSSTVIMAAVGLASQESLSNIVSGLLISIFKPFKVGDRVKLTSSGITGIIKDINLRHTLLLTFQNTYLVIPNSIINKDLLENSSLLDEKYCNFLDFKVNFNSDIKQVKSIVEEVVCNHPFYIDTRIDNKGSKVTTMIRDISSGGIDFRVSIWTENVGKNFQMCSEVREQLIETFTKQGIKLCERYLIDR